ncbi:hypothetical protein D3C87_2167290 [compost metagenome]
MHHAQVAFKRQRVGDGRRAVEPTAMAKLHGYQVLLHALRAIGHMRAASGVTADPWGKLKMHRAQLARHA